MLVRFIASFLALFAISPLVAQFHPFGIYQTKSMSSNALVLSIQQAGTSRRVVRPALASIECSSATRFTIEIDCETPATETVITPTSRSITRRASGISAFTDSDAASCTVISNMVVPAATPMQLDLTESIYLPAKTGDYSLVLRTATVTSGTCYGFLTWNEQ